MKKNTTRSQVELGNVLKRFVINEFNWWDVIICTIGSIGTLFVIGYLVKGGFGLLL